MDRHCHWVAFAGTTWDGYRLDSEQLSVKMDSRVRGNDNGEQVRKRTVEIASLRSQ